jgi:type VI secretion system protein ImpL
MSHLGSELRSVFGVAGVASVYGIASLLILYLGPQYGFGIAYQLLVIGLILLTLPVGLVIQHRRRRKARLADAADGEPEVSADKKGRRGAGKQSGAPAGTYEHLTRGAEEVVQWLRGTKLGGGDAADAVYALPWFLITGPPASGKTSFVLSSRLHFQTLPGQRHAEHRLVRPTRSCEWRVTDEAVLLDTAGRYHLEGANEDEWVALIEILKRHRARRALDGVVIVVSAAWAASESESEIERQAEVLRARLNEVLERTGVRCPVYLVWTHADAVEGFGQFFSRLPHAEVWGATLPLAQAQSENAHALFDVEFDKLYDALLRQRLARLSLTEQPAEQLAVFNFPPRVDETRNALAHFTTMLFRPIPFYRGSTLLHSPLLRGFYFTANVDGAQTTREADAPAREEEGQQPDDGAGRRASVSTRTVGEGFFIEQFFKNVLLRDKDLAAALQPPKSRPYRWLLALLALGAMLSLFLLAGLGVSYQENERLLADARKRAARVEERMRLSAAQPPAAQDPLEARIDIEALESLRETVAALDDYERNGPPLRLRFGLYAGERINPQVRAVYFEALTQRYFKAMLSTLEKDLRTFGTGSTPAAQPPAPAEGADAPDEETTLGKHYDLLKAYLMLTSEPTRVEPTFLAAQLADYWRAASPPDMENVSRQQLDFYAQQANRPGVPRAKADDKLVSQARTRLAAYPAVNRYYKRVTTEINARTRPVTLGSILGGRGGGVLSGSYTVPGSYTLEGFREQISPAFESAAEEMSKDDWVMGPTRAEGSASAVDTSKLWSLYFRDYTDHWRRFLRATSVNSFRGKDDAVTALKALTATDSPMELVVESVARNTDLSARPSTGFFGWIKSLIWGSSAFNTEGNSEVEREFRPLIEFASAAQNKDAVGVSKYRAELLQVLNPLEGATQDQLSQTSRVILTEKDEFNLKSSEQAVNRLLDNFSTAAGRDAAALLKQPLENLRGMFYGEGYEQIAREWRDQIYPAARRLEDGYPFTAAGESSVSDLSRFLNPVDGLLTNFFKTRLAASFDDVQGQWRLKESGGYKFTDEFVNYLNNARRLREALFTDNGKQQPAFNYNVTLQPVPNADTRLEIDGQSPLSAGGTSAASGLFQFPARAGGNSGVRIVINADGQQHEKSFNGEWGLFRFMQAAGGNTPGADNSYSLSLGVDGYAVRATLRPPSPSPFERKLFSDMHAPQNIGQ